MPAPGSGAGSPSPRATGVDHTVQLALDVQRFEPLDQFSRAQQALFPLPLTGSHKRRIGAGQPRLDIRQEGEARIEVANRAERPSKLFDAIRQVVVAGNLRA